MIHRYTTYYFIDKLDREEIFKLNKDINIILRNYKIKFNAKDIKKIIKLCHSKKQKIFIANDFKSAFKYNFDGVYLPSFNKINNLKNLSMKKNFKIIGSAHNLREIIVKINQSCSEIFVSPIFKTYKDNYLNITKFNILNLLNPKTIIALGGLNKKNIKKLKMTKSKGFASISWIKKTGLQ